VALWRQPDVLAVDEPTNHLDREARRLLAQALAGHQGIGLLVSHDRELLDGLCRQCLFIEPPGIVVRQGNYTSALEERRREELAARRRYRSAAAARKRIEREVAHRRDAAQQADRQRSKRSIPRKDRDAKTKIDRARLAGKDAIAGKLLRQMEGRLGQAQQKQAEIKVRKQHELGIWLPGSCAATKVLCHLPAGTLPLGDKRWLRHPDLVLLPSDRVALVGPNGSGKSTLIRHLLSELRLPAERLTYIPQEIDREATREIMRAARNLPPEKLGHVMVVVSRLNSRPDRLLDSDEPSPGEIRKLLLAMRIVQQPHLVVMDEPTNHMDLPSIECLEEALEGCPCALVLVSHDERFLSRLTEKRWMIGPSDRDPGEFLLRA
jgi:macrolide transport system ATP-binding/permease protein